VCVIYTTVFEYQNQVIINMTVFDGGPSLVILTLAIGIQKKGLFWNTKSKSYFNMTLFEGGSYCFRVYRTELFCRPSFCHEHKHKENMGRRGGAHGAQKSAGDTEMETGATTAPPARGILKRPSPVYGGRGRKGAGEEMGSKRPRLEEGKDESVSVSPPPGGAPPAGEHFPCDSAGGWWCPSCSTVQDALLQVCLNCCCLRHDVPPTETSPDKTADESPDNKMDTSPGKTTDEATDETAVEATDDATGTILDKARTHPQPETTTGKSTTEQSKAKATDTSAGAPTGQSMATLTTAMLEKKARLAQEMKHCSDLKAAAIAAELPPLPKDLSPVPPASSSMSRSSSSRDNQDDPPKPTPKAKEVMMDTDGESDGADKREMTLTNKRMNTLTYLGPKGAVMWKTAICKSFQHGGFQSCGPQRCAEGDNCSFAHNDAELVCKRWVFQNGSCSFGTNCKHAHDVINTKGSNYDATTRDAGPTGDNIKSQIAKGGRGGGKTKALTKSELMLKSSDYNSLRVSEDAQGSCWTCANCSAAVLVSNALCGNCNARRHPLSRKAGFWVCPKCNTGSKTLACSKCNFKRNVKMTKACIDFQVRTCKAGRNCRYIHLDSSAYTLPGDELCARFSQGKCTAGRSCMYTHAKLNPMSIWERGHDLRGDTVFEQRPSRFAGFKKGDWECPHCNFHCYAMRWACPNCERARAKETLTYPYVLLAVHKLHSDVTVLDVKSAFEKVFDKKDWGVVGAVLDVSFGPVQTFTAALPSSERAAQHSTPLGGNFQTPRKGLVAHTGSTLYCDLSQATELSCPRNYKRH
jgi:hypothetical protein